MNLLNKFYKLILLPHDKANHAFWGLFTYSLIALYDINIAIIATLVSAVSKEVVDEITYGGFDIKDLIYTIAVPLILFGISSVQ